MIYLIGSVVLGWKVVFFRPPRVGEVQLFREEGADEAVCDLLLHGSGRRKQHTVKERARTAQCRMASSRQPLIGWPKCRVSILRGAASKVVRI
jgi:hypothetical protein